MSLLEKLEIPTLEKQRIPIKTMIEQLQPTPENKRLIESHVGSIYLVSLLNKQTIHFRPYKDEDYSYQAIYVLQITLKKPDQLTDVSIQLHSAFPEPTLLLLDYGDNEWMSAAPKHINKLDATKTVLDDVVVQQVDNKLDISLKHLSSIDLMDYYTQIVQLTYKIGVYNVIHIFPTQNLDYKNVIKEYQQITSNINILKEQYKKATMKSEKMDIDDQIYDEEMKQKQLTKKLKGEISNG
ncbi:DUF4391 domain-containing protein [Sharpea azabuensis]|uniref:DUF4391 domain-containing protein n=1 Tax=Sharpea azabuensis TaxID=322505 RepID=UPI001566CECD|nr:DUF4391 domain-containing protein [Sharpea azabuensis]